MKFRWFGDFERGIFLKRVCNKLWKFCSLSTISLACSTITGDTLRHQYGAKESYPKTLKSSFYTAVVERLVYMENREGSFRTSSSRAVLLAYDRVGRRTN